jgi:D-3-phosphoglycerate dehydrogenase
MTIQHSTFNTQHSPRIGSALFNGDHTRLREEVQRIAAAGVDFVHFDVFDGHFVPDMAFAPRTIAALRPLTALPFEVHLAADDPVRFVPALARAGANLVFLPAESTPLLYEAIFAVREQGLQAGLCLALGTPLGVLEPVLPLLDAVLLLGRVTGEGQRGRDFNQLLVERVRRVRAMIDAGDHTVDLQAAGGLETESCRAVVAAGATSLPLGAALHREPDMAAFVAHLRHTINPATITRPATHATTQNSKLETRNYNVLIASRSFGPNCPAALERMQAAGCTLVANPWGRAPTEAELIEQIGDVDALISGTEPVTAQVIAAAQRLKVISKHGVGYENIDLAAAAQRGIPVAIAGGAIADSVADMALALILALARHVPQGDRAVRAGRWPRLVGMQLRGKTLGIVGLGQIGKAVCRRAVGFGLNVVAYDAYPDMRFAASWGVRFMALDELLANADIVTLHAPALPETYHLISHATLARMKPTALLINTARGDLVDEAALADALQRGLIAGAASDVFQHEPPGQSALLALDTFIATPHSAGQTEDGLRQMGEITAENALLVLAGQQPLFRVS